MATEYSITYTYTGQTNVWSDNTPMIVTKDKFTLTGDTDKHISKINRIVYRHCHTSTGTYATWKLYGRLHFSDGSHVDSDTQSYQFNKNAYTYENTFEGNLPSASQFETWTQIETIPVDYSSGRELYWRATADYPMTVTVYFEACPPVFQNIGGVWTELNTEGIYGKGSSGWLPADEIAKV